MLDCGLKIHSRCPDAEERRSNAGKLARSFQRIWALCKKQRGEPAVSPRVFQREAESGKGYQDRGQGATILTPGCGGWPGGPGSLLPPGLSLPQCERAGVMSQMSPVLDKADRLRMLVKGQRWHVTITGSLQPSWWGVQLSSGYDDQGQGGLVIWIGLGKLEKGWSQFILWSWHQPLADYRVLSKQLCLSQTFQGSDLIRRTIVFTLQQSWRCVLS